jgi:hypothetical protein
MKKIYLFAALLFAAFSLSAQTTQTIDLSTVDGTLTTTFEDELVIDAAECASAIADPLLSFNNPLKGKTFSEAEISFDVYNYHGTDSIKVLGALISFWTLGADPQERLYFSNGGYLGWNIGNDNWLDANMNAYALDTDFLGGNAWKNVRLRFFADGYAMYVDDVLAFDNNSTDVTIASGANFDPATIVTYLQNTDLFVVGTGSWWSDNTRDDGTYWDAQYSYLKNIRFVQDPFAVTVQPADVQEPTVVSEEYFNITGARMTSKFEDLEPGIYIRRALLDNGKYRSEKIMKFYHLK